MRFVITFGKRVHDSMMTLRMADIVNALSDQLQRRVAQSLKDSRIRECYLSALVVSGHKVYVGTVGQRGLNLNLNRLDSAYADEIGVDLAFQIVILNARFPENESIPAWCQLGRKLLDSACQMDCPVFTVRRLFALRCKPHATKKTSSIN